MDKDYSCQTPGFMQVSMFGRFSLRSFVRPRGEIRQGTSNGCPLPGGSWEHCPPKPPPEGGSYFNDFVEATVRSRVGENYLF